MCRQRVRKSEKKYFPYVSALLYNSEKYTFLSLFLSVSHNSRNGVMAPRFVSFITSAIFYFLQQYRQAENAFLCSARNEEEAGRRGLRINRILRMHPFSRTSLTVLRDRCTAELWRVISIVYLLLLLRIQFTFKPRYSCTVCRSFSVFPARVIFSGRCPSLRSTAAYTSSCRRSLWFARRYCLP